jgi:SAM-dependent methyltransferase
MAFMSSLTDHQVTDHKHRAGRRYALGSDAEEAARLHRQADELAPETSALLGRLGLRPGQVALDLGCGPRGIIDALAAAVAPGGRVVGVDANPAHVERARQHAEQREYANVEVIAADARHTGLPGGTFDLVHARTLLASIPEPAQVLTEMARLARPGGWVASQEPGGGTMMCYPPIPAWDQLYQLFVTGFSGSGANPQIGAQVVELYRQAGFVQVEFDVHVAAYPAGHSRRSLLPDLVRSLRPTLIERGVTDGASLAELDGQVRAHLANPDVVMVSHLLFAVWGRRPAE